MGQFRLSSLQKKDSDRESKILSNKFVPESEQESNERRPRETRTRDIANLFDIYMYMYIKRNVL